MNFVDLIELLFSNKKNIVLIAIGYVIIVIVALIIIWKPDTILEISKYEPYNESEKQKEMASLYFSLVQDVLMYNSKSDLSSIVSNKYLEYTGQSIEELTRKLNVQGKLPPITDVSFQKLGDQNIYIGNLNVNSALIPICVIEEYPYDIKITFDNFIDYYDINSITSKNKFYITAKSVYKNLNYVEYDIELSNKGDEPVNIDFSIATNICLYMKNGQEVYLSNPYDINNTKSVQYNEIVNRKIIFNISILEQDEIKSIGFKNILIDGREVNLEINL